MMQPGSETTLAARMQVVRTYSGFMRSPAKKADNYAAPCGAAGLWWGSQVAFPSTGRSPSRGCLPADRDHVAGAPSWCLGSRSSSTTQLSLLRLHVYLPTEAATLGHRSSLAVRGLMVTLHAGGGMFYASSPWKVLH